MLQRHLVLLATVLLVCSTGTVFSQPPHEIANADPGRAMVANPANPPHTMTASDVLTNTPSVSHEPVWRTDILLGLPTGLRIQRRIADTRLWGEIGGGIYLISPNMYLGIRGDSRLLERPRHTIFARPGLVTAYNPGYNVERHGGSWNLLDFDRVHSFGYTGIDCDISWRARWSGRIHGELGLKVGLALAYSLESNRGSGYFLPVIPLPLLGISAGLNY
jgi:hypothetical protein